VESIFLQKAERLFLLLVFWQEQVFGTLILLSSSTLVDIHSAAHGVLQNLKVLPAHFSTQVSLC